MIKNKMKVKDLILKLQEYNQEAEIECIVNNKVEDFDIVFGDTDGCTKKDCKSVSFYIDSEKEEVKVSLATMLDYPYEPKKACEKEA